MVLNCKNMNSQYKESDIQVVEQRNGDILLCPCCGSEIIKVQYKNKGFVKDNVKLYTYRHK